MGGNGVTENGKSNGLARRVEADLRQAILRELERRHLADPQSLASALDAPVVATSEFLRQGHWPISTYCDLIDTLELPVTIQVS